MKQVIRAKRGTKTRPLSQRKKSTDTSLNLTLPHQAPQIYPYNVE